MADCYCMVKSYVVYMGAHSISPAGALAASSSVRPGVRDKTDHCQFLASFLGRYGIFLLIVLPDKQSFSLPLFLHYNRQILHLM